MGRPEGAPGGRCSGVSTPGPCGEALPAPRPSARGHPRPELLNSLSWGPPPSGKAVRKSGVKGPTSPCTGACTGASFLLDDSHGGCSTPTPRGVASRQPPRLLGASCLPTLPWGRGSLGATPCPAAGHLQAAGPTLCAEGRRPARLGPGSNLDARENHPEAWTRPRARPAPRAAQSRSGGEAGGPGDARAARAQGRAARPLVAHLRAVAGSQL